MKLLVTGGCGFIGSNFIHHMLSKYPNYEITNLDKLTYCGNPENLKEVEQNPNYKFIHGDIVEPSIVNHTIKDADAVIHFAAESHVDNSIEGPEVFTKTNVLGTHNLLEAARKNNLKKFIHISTDEVYGSIKQGSFTEDSKLKPNSPYSASKAASDLLVRSYVKTFKLPAIITRSSNNIGPRQYPEKLNPLFITNLIRGKQVPVYGTGLNVRDWLYVDDHCEAIDFVLHNGDNGEVYNIGGGTELTNLEITKMILNELNKGEEYIKYVEDRLGHDWRYSIDCSKLNNLGWKARHDFSSALKKTVDWYKNNESWWMRLISA